MKKKEEKLETKKYQWSWIIIKISKAIGFLTMSIMLITSFIYGWWLVASISAVSILFLAWLNRKFFKKTETKPSPTIQYIRKENSTNENHR